MKKRGRLKWDDGAGCEILTDGHRFVSIMTIDGTGDDTLVYLTRSRALVMADRIKEAAHAIGVKSKRKTRSRA